MNTDFNAVNAAINAAIKSSFEELIADASVPSIAYNDNWANGTGYFDGLAREDRDGYSVMFKSVDPHGRNILFIQCNYRRAVIFERTTDTRRLCCHVPKYSKYGWLDAGGEMATAYSQSGLTAYYLLNEAAEVGLSYYTDWATAQAA